MTELFRTLLNMSAESCWVILAVLALRLLLRRAPKGYAYALWSVVLFRLLCPVSFQSAVNLFTLAGVRPEPVPAGFGSAPVFTAALDEPPGQAASAAASGAVTPPAATGEPTAAAFGEVTLMQLLAALWLLGAAIMAIYGLCQLVRLLRRLRWRIADADGVYRVAGLETAFVLGLVRPRIYLPAGLAPEQERYILAHENAHLRRGDPLWRVLAFAALCLHWFNPLVWAAFLLSERDMEMSCDEAVVRRFGPQIKKGYTASLLSLAAGRRVLPGTPLAFGEGDTGPRIRNVLNYKKPAFWAAALAAVAVAGLCLFLAANPKAAGQSTGAGETRLSFTDAGGAAHTAAFTLPEGWAFAPQPVPEGVTGVWQTVGTLSINGAEAGQAYVAAFDSVYERDEDTQRWALDETNPNRHNAAYSDFMLGSFVDWRYTVLEATPTTEAAVSDVYANMGQAGAMAGGPTELTGRAALYFDLDESAYLIFELEPGAVGENSEELAALARSIRFVKAENVPASSTPAAPTAQGDTLLKPLYTADIYENGSLFADVPADLEQRLQSAISAGLVPDRRSGQKAVSMEQRPWQKGGAGVVLLGEYPAKNLYLYGYYDETTGPLGLIVDAGDVQNLTAFPFRYTTAGRLGEPVFYLAEDGGTLYMICETGTGTGVAIDELLVFRLDGGTVTCQAVDSGAVADAFAARLTAQLHPQSEESLFEGEWVTFGAEQGTLLSGGLTALGLPTGADTTPASYFCGQFLGYTMAGSTLYATCRPVMFNAAGEGFLYLEDEEELQLVMPVGIGLSASGAVSLDCGPMDAWYSSALTELDEAARADSGCHILSAARQWQADLNHDGEPEAITFDLAALEARGFANLTVYDDMGNLLVSEQFSTSHAGWNTIALYHDETGDYLLSYRPNYMQGAGDFAFSLFSVGADGSWQEREGMEVSFSAGMPYGAPDNDVDELIGFAERATALWSRAALLVTTDADIVLNGLFDENGGKAEPGDANYYVADNDLSAPLHYVENMGWTDSALDDPAAVQAAGNDMRARLEAVNQMLAKHRAEAEVQAAPKG